MSIDEELKLNTAPDEGAQGGDTFEEESRDARSLTEEGATAADVQTQSAEVAAESTAQTDDSQDNAEDEQAIKRKHKTSRIVLNVVLVLLIGLGIYSLFGVVNDLPNEGASFGEVFGNASPWFMVLLVVVVLFIMFLDCTKFCIIDKTVTGHFRMSSSIKTSYLGKYYDAVTPFATGGQPMQIYYLKSKGISGGNSTAVVMIRYFSSIIAWATLGAALMIIGTVNHVLDTTGSKTLLLITGWVGIGVNMILPVFIAFFLIFPKIMYKLTGGVVKLGKKMKIVKDEEKALKRATKSVDDFKNSFKVMATSPVKLILLILVSYSEAFLTFSVPFFVMKAFNCGVEGHFITIMSLNAFATFGVSFIPTPGNSGVMESFAALAFSGFAGNTLAWSVLVWRFGVYYVYIIVGLCISVRDIIKKNLVSRREGKKPRKNC